MATLPPDSMADAAPIRIAISYRRIDSTVIAGRIADRLAVRYGREAVFIDVDSIPLGLDFKQYIRDAWARIDVLVAVVGPQWLGVSPDGVTRLHDDNDLIRIELDMALQRAVPIIPVLVEGAAMPAPDRLPEVLQGFAYRNAARVDGGRDFHLHMDVLIRAIDQLGQPKRPSTLPKGLASPIVASPRSPSAGEISLKLLPAARDVATTVVCLLMAQYLIVVALDLNTIYLRVAAFVVPLAAGAFHARRTPRGSLAAAGIAGITALIAVFAMSAITALSFNQPILPATPFEWRESIEYVGIIALAYFLGCNLDRYWSKRRQREG
jgi:hypothetical protein